MIKTTRVQKFIALSGLCSRRKAEVLISEGKVRVNGKIIGLGDQCLSTDIIKVNSKRISFDLDDMVYIILNKPIGFLTTKSDEFGRRNVFELIGPRDRRGNLFSIGRLDKDTSGLLILTNDGQLTQNIIHPSSKIPKEYEVELNKFLDNKVRSVIEDGVILDDYKLASCRIDRISKKKYVVRIWEGKKRQIRRMFAELHYKVLKLHRRKIGGLDLNDMNIESGDYILIDKKFLEERIF